MILFALKKGRRLTTMRRGQTTENGTVKVIACYTRVSTFEQNLAAQRAEIESWLHNHGIQAERVVWYEDKETGATLRRPAFEKLQRDIFDGKVGTVVVWKLDRLSRNLRDGINVLADWADRGLKVVSITQQLEFNGTLGKMLATLLFGLAEMDLGNIRERQRAGIDAAKKRGVYKGRKLGSVKADAARARALRDKGNTASEIASALGISERTVFRYLRS
jgi:DNA invertase Pin-like site-specific DNA recombinase